MGYLGEENAQKASEIAILPATQYEQAVYELAGLSLQDERTAIASACSLPSSTLKRKVAQLNFCNFPLKLGLNYKIHSFCKINYMYEMKLTYIFACLLMAQVPLKSLQWNSVINAVFLAKEIRKVVEII